MKLDSTRSTRTFVGALLVYGLCPHALAAQSGEPQRIALGALATESTASDEQEEHSRTIALPTLGITVHETKRLDQRTDQVVGQALDENGTAVDLRQLLDQEQAARLASPAAKLHPDLQQAIEAGPDTGHEVVIWLRYDGDTFDAHNAELAATLPEDASEEQVASVEQEMTDFVLPRIEATNGLALAELIGLGIDVRYTSTSSPAIFVVADAAQVMLIAASEKVDTLYLEKSAEKDVNTSANGTHRADQTYNLGMRGAGRRVAVLENNGVSSNCPHLNVSGWYNFIFQNPDDHVHGTSGCIASRLASRRGGAPDVTLFSANASSYSDVHITAAADWIVSQNIDVTNMSYGGGYSGVLQYKDRLFDYQSRVFTDSYVASAGNDGGFVGSPGTAWNCITVGAFNDFDTSSWVGDSISSFSDWRNPTTGCEKPNLAAVGDRVDTLGMAPDWLRDDYSGTSFSAPFTTAALAVCMSRDSSAVLSPEAAMAAMMATAWHNIEGASRLSSRDGAGGLHQRGAAQCAAGNRISYVGLYPSSFTNNGYYTYNIYLVGGDTARVCIAWSANANSSYTSTLLNADLDLTVLAGANATTGTSYGSSLSFNNNFEIVEFTPPTSGTYTIRINDYRFNGSYERVGLAWSQRNRDFAN